MLRFFPSLSRAPAQLAPLPRKRGAVVAIVCVAALLLAAILTVALIRNGTPGRVLRATVRVMVPAEQGDPHAAAVQGTGVIISKQGHVLTAAHVVRTATSGAVQVVLGSGTRRAEVLTARLTEHVGAIGSPSPREMGGDYALLKLPPSRSYPFVKVAKGDRIAAGTECYLAGFAMADGPGASGRGPRARLQEGHITAVMRSGAGTPTALNTDIPVREGMSGGPCTDPAGELLGLAVMYSSQANANLVLPACSFRHVWEPLLAGRSVQ